MKRSLTYMPIILGIALAAGSAAAATAAESEREPTAGAAAPTIRQWPTVSGLLTLDRAVSTALQESPVVRGAVDEVNIAVQELRAAQAQRRPILSTTTFLSGGSNANTTITPAPVMPQMIMGLPRGGFYDQNLSLMVPLYTGGRLDALVRRADADRKASSADLAEVKLEVALLTRVAYRTTQVRQAFLAVYQDLVRTNEERVRIDRIAFTEGRIAQYPVLRDETELANANQQLTDTERDRDMALVQLKTVMGVNFAPDVSLEGSPPFQPLPALLSTLPGFTGVAPEAKAVSTAGSQPAVLSAPDARPRDTSPAPATPSAPGTAATAAPGAAPPSDTPSAARLSAPALDRLLLLAEQRRPVLAAQQFRLQAAGQGIRAAHSAYLPQISLFAMGDALQGANVNQFNGYTAGVAIGLPLLDGGMRRAEMRKARAEQERQEQQVQQTVLQVTQEVTNNWLALRAAERNVATAQAGVRSGDEDYRIAQIRYAEGKSVNVEALDALAARTRAQVNFAKAQFEYQIAADQLRRSLGLQ